MLRATWNGAILAEADSDSVLALDGGVYFPPETVDHSYLRESRTQTTDPQKGIATFYDVVVEREVNPDAAWTYPAPHSAAEEIAGYIAFRKGVAVEQDD